MIGSQIFPYDQYLKLERDHCPVCQTATTRRRHANTIDRYGFPVTIVGCEQCQLVYLYTPMYQQGYLALYAGEPSPYRQLVWMTRSKEPYNLAKDRTSLFLSQQHYARDLAAWLNENILSPTWPPTRVLDIGGSTGMVSRVVAPDAKRTIVDPAESELQLVEHDQVVHGCLESVYDLEGPYDLILCCQTLDHFLYPEWALWWCRQVVALRGRLYIDYVALSRIKIDHPCYFNDRSFRTLLARTGWQIVLRRPSSGRNHIGYLCTPC